MAIRSSLLVCLVVLGSLTACQGASETGGEGGSGGEALSAISTSAQNGGGGWRDSEPRACDGFATEVVTVDYGPGAGFGQDQMPHIVLGPPEGGSTALGSLDVLSLGNGGSIVLGFAGSIVDQPGPDFIVFENVFYAGGDPSAPFAEIARVEVSADGETWLSFPCTATESPFEGCAGWHPTLASSSAPEIDAHDPQAAGGEAFDLADVGLSEARYVRIVDREDLTGFAGSFDLDAVSLVHWACDAE